MFRKKIKTDPQSDQRRRKRCGRRAFSYYCSGKNTFFTLEFDSSPVVVIKYLPENILLHQGQTNKREIFYGLLFIVVLVLLHSECLSNIQFRAGQSGARAAYGSMLMTTPKIKNKIKNNSTFLILSASRTYKLSKFFFPHHCFAIKQGEKELLLLATATTTTTFFSFNSFRPESLQRKAKLISTSQSSCRGVRTTFYMQFTEHLTPEGVLA